MSKPCTCTEVNPDVINAAISNVATLKSIDSETATSLIEALNNFTKAIERQNRIAKFTSMNHFGMPAMTRDAILASL